MQDVSGSNLLEGCCFNAVTASIHDFSSVLVINKEEVKLKSVAGQQDGLIKSGMQSSLDPDGDGLLIKQLQRAKP